MIDDIKVSDMDSNLLKVFLSVARHKSISKAAQELNFAQSNVSSRVKQLEKNIGHELFFRVPKGVVLTKAGEKLFSYAFDIVKKIDEANFHMKNISKQSSLKVASTESNAVVRMVPFLTSLHEDFPKMNLDLLTGTTSEVINMILDYKVDIAFVSGVPISEELLVINKIEEEIVLLEAKEEAVPDVLILFKQGCKYNDILQEYYKKEGKSSYKTLEFGSYETILGCVKAGMGKTMMPLSIVKKLKFENELKITELEDEFSYIPTCMVCRKDNLPIIKEYLQEYKL